MPRARVFKIRMPWPSAAGLDLVEVWAPDVGRGGDTDEVGQTL